MKKLAVFFPGIGYTADRSLLYFCRKIAAKYGYGALCVTYRDLPKDAKSSREKMEECVRLAEKQAEETLQKAGLSEYDRILFAGKSIGTIVSAALAEKSGLSGRIRQILYTPLEETFSFHIPDGIVFTGGNDPWVGGENSRIAALCREKGIPCFVVPDANHSLETDDPLGDVDSLKRIMLETERFIREEA